MFLIYFDTQKELDYCDLYTEFDFVKVCFCLSSPCTFYKREGDVLDISVYTLVLM